MNRACKHAAITGANGLIGHALCNQAIDRGWMVRGISRIHCKLPKDVDGVVVDDIHADIDWGDALAGCDAVVHLANRVHVIDDKASDPLAEYRRVNVQGSLNLARQAAAAGVKRFVFVSSIKVNGEQTPMGSPYTADDVPAPLDAYGVSKMEAEQGLPHCRADRDGSCHHSPAAGVWPGCKG